MAVIALRYSLDMSIVAVAIGTAVACVPMKALEMVFRRASPPQKQNRDNIKPSSKSRSGSESSGRDDDNGGAVDPNPAPPLPPRVAAPSLPPQPAVSIGTDEQGSAP